MRWRQSVRRASTQCAGRIGAVSHQVLLSRRLKVRKAWASRSPHSRFGDPPAARSSFTPALRDRTIFWNVSQ